MSKQAIQDKIVFRVSMLFAPILFIKYSVFLHSCMKKYTYNLEVFYNENALSYYLLGAFITDGCVTRNVSGANVSLTSKDKDWLEIISRHICPDKPLLTHGTNNSCYRLTCYKIAIADWLIAHGCIPNKSLIVKMPNIPPAYILDFIRGCWDGDGSLQFTQSANKGKNFRRRAHLTTGSKSFANSISCILTSFGIKNYIETRRPKKNRKIEDRTITANNLNYRVHITSGKATYELVKLLYVQPIIAMPRKQQIACNIIKDWEKIFNCVSCNVLLNDCARNKKYCNNCALQKERNRSRSRYYAAK